MHVRRAAGGLPSPTWRAIESERSSRSVRSTSTLSVARGAGTSSAPRLDSPTERAEPDRTDAAESARIAERMGARTTTWAGKCVIEVSKDHERRHQRGVCVVRTHRDTPEIRRKRAELPLAW